MPLRRPVVTVGEIVYIYRKTFFQNHLSLVGKPISVKQNVNATSDEIDQLHNEYIQAVEQLFELNKNKYRLDHVKLEIV